MSRDANGAYKLPAGVASASYLSDAQIQAAFGDVAAELTNSPRASQMSDLAGIATTTGSGAAYALTLNTPWTTLPNGLPFVFRAHAANPGASTIALNGKAAIPLRLGSAADLPAGALKKGALYLACLNLSSFVLGTFGNLTTGSNQITSMTSTAGLVVGQSVTVGSAGLPEGTTIQAISGSTVTLSAAYNGVSSTGAAVNVVGPEVLIVSALPTPRPLAKGLAATGAVAAAALQLDASINEVASVPAGTGVMLPAREGETIAVVNAGANELNVYPPNGGSINALAANAPYALAAGAVARFVMVSATRAYV